MNLDNFDQQIDPKIVDRGYNYFFDDHVDGPESIDTGVWMARVYGSYVYNVQIHTEPENSREIRGWQCDCPYDFGPICKHVVAALYAMIDQEKSEPDSADEKRETKPKNRIQEIFKKSNEEDLQNFILASVKSVDGFRNRFLAHFADRIEDQQDPILKYRAIIRNYGRAAEGPYGFIDHESDHTLTARLRELNQKAEELLDDGHFNECLGICQPLVEETAVFIQNMHDSSGSAGGVIPSAFDTIGRLADGASSEIEQRLFEWCMQEFPLEKYHDFDLDYHFLELMPQLVSSNEQEEQFFNFLDHQIEAVKSSSYFEYRVTRLIKVKVRYLQQQARHEEVLQLLEANKEMTDFREMLANRSLKQGDYETAIKLCHKGIALAKEKNHRGTVSRWREKLLQIAKQENDMAEMRKWAEILFFSSFSKRQWYQSLKSTYSGADWSEKCEEIIERLREEDRQGYQSNTTSTLAQIFVEEQYTDRLLKLVQQHAADISFVDANQLGSK